MSEEHVDLVLGLIAAWNSGRWDAVRELHHPDVIVRGLRGWPEPGPFVGRDAWLRELEALRGSYDVNTLELIGDAREVANRIVARMAWRGTGRGPDLDMEFSTVTTLRDGLIFEVEYFWDHAEALASVGLSG